VHRGAQPASVRALLLWLMLACLLPGALGAGAILYRSYINERVQLEHDTLQTARALMQTVDAELSKAKAVAQTLATSKYLVTNDFARFHAQAQAVVPLLGYDCNLILIDSTGQQLLNTLKPFPSVLPRHGNLELVHRIISTGQPVISDIYVGAVRNQPITAIAVPVWQGGSVQYVLSFTFAPQSMGKILTQQQLPPDWVVSIFDGQGRIAFRSHGADRFVGQKGAPALVALMAETTEGMLEANTLEGIPVSAVFSRSVASNWSVAIGIPTQSSTAKLQRRFLWLAAAIAGLLGAGTLLALTLARRIGGSVRALREPALALGKGEVVPVPPLYLKEADDVGAALVTASNLLRRAETLRLESDAKLTATAHRLEAHLRNSPLAIIEFDRDFHVQRWSAEAERLFGWSEEVMLGQSCLDMRWVDETDSEKVQQSRAELQAGACNSNICRNRNYRQDGTVIDCEWYNSALHDQDGNLVSILSQILDVSERKRAEADLRAAVAAAERANNAKSRFLAAASHDLRQPLAALSLYVNILKNKVTLADKKLVTQLKECVDSLSGLLNDLLDLSKLEAGVVTPNVSDFSIAAMLNSLKSVHAMEAAVKGLQLRYRPTGLTGRTDSVLFRRIVGNLIHNAIRYTEHGGVLVACRRRRDKTWLEVCDTGIGIPADQTEDIFEEFRQLGDQARNNGSGLGLAIVAKTAALLGLEVSVRSRPGRGSIFAIELPVGESTATKSVSLSVEVMPLCIALVEDNHLVRNALTESLQAMGHQVVAAVSQEALFAALDTWSPDVVISDYRLARGETGFDVITALRRRFGAELPAILITGDTAPTLMRSMTDRGITVLHKPIELDALQACLETLTGKVR